MQEENQFQETVVQIRRVSKKTKGGQNIRFSALVVVGDKKGKVGVAVAKAPDVSSAIKKSFSRAKRKMIVVPLKANTVPYSVTQKFGAAQILIKPAPPGSGIIAGGTMRIILESAGIKDAVGKIMGTNNKTTNAYATIEALNQITKIRSRKEK